MLSVVVPEVAHQMGLVPLVWCALRRERRLVWWWLAAAFSVSWLADTAVHFFGYPWVASAVYPVLQTGIIGAVFLPSAEAKLLTAVLVVIGCLAIFREGMEAPPLLLHLVAWGAIVGIVWPLPASPLRDALLTAFGVNLMGWLLFSLTPTWGTWGLYQTVRALSLAMFCWARSHQPPRVRFA